MTATFKVACVQMSSGSDIDSNIAMARRSIEEAAAKGAQFVLTPENTTFIGKDEEKQSKSFREEAHPGIPVFADLARSLHLWLLIGSMAIKVEEGRVANRSFLFGPDGTIHQTYDKIHLFDVDLANQESYRESKSVRPGKVAKIASLPWGVLGMTICYDLRFAYLHRALAQAGADFLAIPAAFTIPTGRAHWHVLLRARAIETGCFVFAPAQCGVHGGNRRTYGHSLIVSPWGEILAEAGEEPGVIVADIDPEKVREARAMIPALRHDSVFERIQK